MNYILRKCKYEDFKFIYNLKEKCFKWYVKEIYGWDEDIQIDLTKKEMDRNLPYMNIIQYDKKDIGLFTFYDDENKHSCIGMFAILPKYQGKGIGTQILNDVLSKNKGKRIYLKTFKENPARFLYERVGFKKYSETNTHWLMEI